MAQTGQKIVVELLQRRGWVSALNMGLGLAYAVDKEKYSQVPLALLFPSAYVGYQVYGLVKEYDVYLRKTHVNGVRE